jgi:hypothetical protein
MTTRGTTRRHAARRDPAGKVVEAMKASGFVAAALARHWIEGAVAAPPSR